MENSNKVLVFEALETGNKLKIEYIDDETIPETLNGESGFHVYHVRMLTGLIMGEMAKRKPELNLTEKDIDDMAIASSLHDIGKSRVPESILNFPGKLSPIEYDIVKKHSVFGEEIIDEIKTDVDPAIIKYAKEIARYHHERIDGTGYPDGLKENIPLCAQAVSIADAFDALTSERTYKKAFSQDVAIEMIANGMSGTFSGDLVECLLKVVNNNVLVKIREKLKEERSVISAHSEINLKKALIIGNTGYVTKEFMEEAFFDCHVTVAGETHLSSEKGLKVFNLKKPSYKRIFETYEFDVIVYFARELNFSCTMDEDAQDLREALNLIKDTQKDAKIIYFSSLDAGFASNTDKAILTRSKETLCEYFRDTHSLNIKIVRVPYLYNSAYESDWLYNIFDSIHTGKTVKINQIGDALCHFISVSELGELVSKFLDNWKDGTGILTVNDEFGITFFDLYEKIREICPKAKIDFTGDTPQKEVPFNNRAITNEYGWFSKVSLVHDLEDQYEKYLNFKSIKLDSFWDKAKDWVRRHNLFMKLLELFGLFIITEILLRLTNSSVVFSIVDFRMAYIVIMATTHGLTYGISASALSSLSWLMAKIESGTNLLTIFYEPSNWLAFIFFFLIGSVCGYIKLKKDNDIADLTEQNILLTDKLVFTRELYNDTYSEKRILKKQIIGSKDSFGKIFDITRQLNTVDARELYLKIMDTFEDILENKSISVYSITQNSAFGRLEVASKDIVQNAARSISLDTFAPVIGTIEKNDIWKNTSLEPSLPMYASGIFRSGKLELLILIWHSNSDQRSLYYVNLFKILCDLVQMSLLRALDYNNAVRESLYIKGTHIMNTEAFEKNREHFKKMAERKVFSYILLEVDKKDHSLEEADKMLEGKVRANDIIGLSEDGKLIIMLSQATSEDLRFVLPRFENIDIEVKEI